VIPGDLEAIGGEMDTPSCSKATESSDLEVISTLFKRKQGAETGPTAQGLPLQDPDLKR
jgi:hypothetical protein